MSEEITHQFPDSGFEMILTRLDSLDSRMAGLEEKVDRRLMETRPIWEQVLKRFDAVEVRFDGFETRFDGVETRFDGFETRFDGVETRFDGVENRLNGVETALNGVETRLGGVEIKLVGVEDRLGKVEHELYGLGKKFRLFNQEILDIQNAHEDLEERVTGLETPRST